MNELPIRLYLSQDVKTLDGLAMVNDEISAHQLMSRAGQAAFNLLLVTWPQVTYIEVCCGVGNNGGDGYVLALLARAQGLKVKLYQVGAVVETKFSAAAQQARADWLASGGEIIFWEGQAFAAEVIVDAIFGIGVRLPLAADCQAAIESINHSGIPILALDIPSGLNPDTGFYETAIQATVTITFVALKLGLMCGNSFAVVGQLYFDNLGVSTNLYPQIKPAALRLTYPAISQLLPMHSGATHKGDNGHVIVIGGGQPSFSGAACLCSEAALRSGAGLVSAVVAPESLPLMTRGPAEIMCYGLTQTKELSDLLAKASVIVLGPGLTQTKWAKSFYQECLKTSHRLVVDADGLNLLAQHPQKNAHWVLTPHPGEAARLLDISSQMVQQDRRGAALALQQKYGGIVVLKGPGTLIVNEEGEIFIQDGSVPALSTAGTGDVLAGLIGGLMSQGLTPLRAAQIAVNVHANAGILEQSLGARGMIASDLFLHIRSLLNPEVQ